MIGRLFAYLPNTAYICNIKHGIYFLSQLPSRMIFGESPYKILCYWVFQLNKISYYSTIKYKIYYHLCHTL